jgi:hypothetical protein
MKIIEKWKEGFEQLIRLLLVGILLHLVTIPLQVIRFLDLDLGVFEQIFAVLYILVLVPISLPAILKASGFELNKDVCDGGMNEAARAKQESLNQEAKG